MPEKSNDKRDEVKRKLTKTAVAVGAAVATGGASAAASGAAAAGSGATAGAAGSAGAAASSATNAAKTSGEAFKKVQSATNRLREAEERSQDKRDIDESSDESSDFTSNVSGVERTQSKKSSGTLSSKAKKLPLYFLLFILAAIPAIFASMTVLYPFHLAANTVGKVVNFVSTAFDKVKHAWNELLGNGEIPDELSEKLAVYGIDTGVIDQVTGEFIKTNRVIASGSEYKIASSIGTYKLESGRLAVKFTDDLGKEFTYKTSEELLDGFETNNEFYNAFKDAIGGDSVFFYDRSGEETFEDLGIDRDPYRDFDSKVEDKLNADSSLSDDEARQKTFKELLDNAIDYDNSESMTSASQNKDAGETESSDAEESSEEASSSGEIPSAVEEKMREAARAAAEKYIASVATLTRGKTQEEATEKAAALINAAISANEPYQATRASTAVIAAAEQAKAGNNGPVNQLANYLQGYVVGEDPSSEGTEEGENIDVYDSNGAPGQAANLLATITDGDYDAAEAAKYSRDRVIHQAETDMSVNSSESVKGTTVSVLSGFKKFFSWIFSLFNPGEKPNETYLQNNFKDAVADALYMKASKVLTGTTLGEKIIEGASFLNASLAKNNGASNVSSKESVVAYNKYTKDLYERNVIADRSRRSPFDASSPNTFLGSIVNSLYTVSASRNSFLGQFASLSSLTLKSFGKLTLGAYAEDDSETFLGASLDAGDHCSTVGAIGGVGELYCNQIPTFDVDNFSGSSISSDKNILTATLSDYESALKNMGDLDDGNKIKDGSELAEDLILGGGRGASPGVKDANVCKTKKQGVTIKSLFNWLFGSAEEISSSCDGVEEEIATGAKYGDLDDNGDWEKKYKIYQGYILETNALEILGYYTNDNPSPVVAYKDAYYEANPKDRSFEGTLAYRTGWSKEDIIAGIEAIEYLAYLNSYDPTERLAFFELPEKTEIYFEENLTPVDVRLADRKEILFDNKRNRVVLI